MMRPPLLRISHDELIVDSFAGGGGASVGIELALGRSPDCPSIFERERPLAENTMRRIARGIQKYVIEAPEPFIVGVGGRMGQSPERSTQRPLQTVTSKGDAALVMPYLVGAGGPAYSGKPASASNPFGTLTAENHRAVITPYMVRAAHGEVGKNGSKRWGRGEHDLIAPVPTVTASNDFALVSPTLIQSGYGERKGQEPRVPGLHKPLGTCVDGQKHALVSAFMAKHYGGGYTGPGAPMTGPVHTVTSWDHHALTAAVLSHQYTSNTCGGQGNPLMPLKTVTTGGHHALVRAFLLKFYSEGGQWSRLRDPMHTVPTKDRMGLVTIAGEGYAIVDIGMRMLQPRELFRAQGFPDSYVIDRGADGTPLSKSAQVRMCGNSVCPPVAAAIVAAQFSVQLSEVAA